MDFSSEFFNRCSDIKHERGVVIRLFAWSLWVNSHDLQSIKDLLLKFFQSKTGCSRERNTAPATFKELTEDLKVFHLIFVITFVHDYKDRFGVPASVVRIILHAILCDDPALLERGNGWFELIKRRGLKVDEDEDHVGSTQEIEQLGLQELAIDGGGINQLDLDIFNWHHTGGWLPGGERKVCDFRSGIGHRGDKGRFSCIGMANHGNLSCTFLIDMKDGDLAPGFLPGFAGFFKFG